MSFWDFFKVNRDLPEFKKTEYVESPVWRISPTYSVQELIDALPNKMTPTKYMEGQKRTENTDFEGIRARFDDQTIRLLHASMGLSTEANEIVDQMKKAIFYGKKRDDVNLKEEAGDLCWYLSQLLDAIGVTFEEAMETNLKKLQARYPEKFTEEAADKRNLYKERQILEE